MCDPVLKLKWKTHLARNIKKSSKNKRINDRKKATTHKNYKRIWNSMKCRHCFIPAHDVCICVERFVFDFYSSICVFFPLASFDLCSWNNAFNSFNSMRIESRASLAYLFIVHRSRHGSMVRYLFVHFYIGAFARVLCKNSKSHYAPSAPNLTKAKT